MEKKKLGTNLEMPKANQVDDLFSTAAIEGAALAIMESGDLEIGYMSRVDFLVLCAAITEGWETEDSIIKNSKYRIEYNTEFLTEGGITGEDLARWENGYHGILMLETILELNRRYNSMESDFDITIRPKRISIENISTGFQHSVYGKGKTLTAYDMEQAIQIIFAKWGD